MAERKEVEKFLEKAEVTIDYAQQVFEDSLRVEPGDRYEYYDAQLKLEEINNDLEALLRVATPEQRDQLIRKQHELRQLQNHMIIGQ